MERTMEEPEFITIPSFVAALLHARTKFNLFDLKKCYKVP